MAMTSSHRLRSLFCALLCCSALVCCQSTAEEDLVDFDFTDLKEIDWNYDNGNPQMQNQQQQEQQQHADEESNILMTLADLEEDDGGEEKNKVRPFEWREHILRHALSKALTNVVMRQKFSEVMPILRVLSAQQRLALSALISAQIKAQRGQELQLNQVRSLFGNDRKLLLPLVYDIANLIQNSARKYVNFDLEVPATANRKLKQTPIQRRKYDLASDESTSGEENTQDIGTISLKAPSEDGSLEDFFGDVADDVLDPQSINEELQADALKPRSTKENNSSIKRNRRSAAAASSESEEISHKLIRSIPLSTNAADIQNGASQLNTTAFELPIREDDFFASDASTPNIILTTIGTTDAIDIKSNVDAYQEVEDLAFANLNGTEIITNTNAAANETAKESKEGDEPLPSPEELIARPRYRSKDGAYLGRTKYVSKRKRAQAHSRFKVPPPATNFIVSKKCERFTASMCIRTDDYPFEQIMGSIRRHQNAMTALLAEYHDKAASTDISDEFDDFAYSKKRREDENSGGGMCQSIVRYARPQKARSASGEWKYIVNTGQHTQTLRLEKCSNPQESCSYLAQQYRSHCSQVYNYHRLLSWDKTRGLHVDIFKVPTCCSCQVDGYRQLFPPHTVGKTKEPTYNRDIYTTINDELDYNDEDEDDDLVYQYGQSFGQPKKDEGFGSNELLLGTKKVRTKIYPPEPTVGSYLSPPNANGDYDVNYSLNIPQQHTSDISDGYNLHGSHRRPYQSEARVDLDLASSEAHPENEVNRARVQQKRKRTYSVPHTANSDSTITTGTIPTHTIAAAAAIPPAHPSRRGAVRNTSSSSINGIAATAYQSPSAATAAAAPVVPTNYVSSVTSNNASKTRFHAASTSSTAATPPTTKSTYHYETSSTLPPFYHVNSIYSAKYNTTLDSGLPVSNPKRINYSYHPIIDFFENNKRSSVPDATNQPTVVTDKSLYPHKILKTNTGAYRPLRERRIGYGVDDTVSGGIGGGGVGSDVSRTIDEDNVWRPVVVQSN